MCGPTDRCARIRAGERRIQCWLASETGRGRLSFFPYYHGR